MRCGGGSVPGGSWRSGWGRRSRAGFRCGVPRRGCSRGGSPATRFRVPKPDSALLPRPADGAAGCAVGSAGGFQGSGDCSGGQGRRDSSAGLISPDVIAVGIGHDRPPGNPKGIERRLRPRVTGPRSASRNAHRRPLASGARTRQPHARPRDRRASQRHARSLFRTLDRSAGTSPLPCPAPGWSVTSPTYARARNGCRCQQRGASSCPPSIRLPSSGAM
jgi:hypothetical protein